MNAYCVICSDRFVSLGGEWDIAAGTCGHTFHSACLATWLESSRTCPTCRKRWGKKDVIAKLYFDHDNTSDEPEEICTARSTVGICLDALSSLLVASDTELKQDDFDVCCMFFAFFTIMLLIHGYFIYKIVFLRSYS